MQQVINDQEVEEEYYVACDEWMGILRVPAPHQGLYGRLTAFTDQSTARIAGQPLIMPDHGDEPFGSVAFVSRSPSDE